MRPGLEYISAFVDCDGTVCVVRSKRDGNQGYRYYGKINLYSQNLQVLCDMREVVGGEISPPNRSLDVYTLQLSPRATVAALKTLLPYLRIKREQALTVLELHKQIDGTQKPRNRSGKGGAARLSEDVYAERQALYERVCALNHEDARAFRTNRDNSVKAQKWVTPSQAAAANDSAEGVTTREVSANNNPLHETPTRKGRHSLSSAVLSTVQ